MCLIAIAYDVHPRHRLVVAANRDEFHDRPTARAGFWADAPHVLAGRDLRAGGTWLGITRAGRFGAVTNFREAGTPPPAPRSRGALVAEFLTGREPAATYARRVHDEGDSYGGFNLLVGDVRSLYYLSNRGGPPRRLEPGVYALSNHLLDTPWPKVLRARAAMEAALGEDPEELEPRLFSMLADDAGAPDAALPDTGVGLAVERALASPFIAGEVYGTRASTVLTVGRDGRARLVERAIPPGGIVPRG